MVIRLRNIRGVPDLEHTGEVVVLVAVMGPLPKEQVRWVVVSQKNVLNGV